MKRVSLCLALLISAAVPAFAGGPFNDSFANAEFPSGGFYDNFVTRSNSGATKESGEPNHAGNTGGSSVWFKWSQSRNVGITFHTRGSEFDTVLAVYTGTSVDALTLVVSNDDIPGAAGGPSLVHFDAVANQIYYIAVDGFGGAQGSFNLRYSGPENDDFANTIVLDPDGGSIGGDNTWGSRESSEFFQIFSTLAENTTWHTYTSPINRRVTVKLTSGGLLAGLLGAFTGTFPDGLVSVAEDQGGIGTSTINFAAQAGVTYNICVAAFQGNGGTYTLDWIPSPKNDDFANAQQLSGLTGMVSGDSAGATRESGEAQHSGTFDGASLWFKWTALWTSNVTFDTIGSTFATGVSASTGTSVDTTTYVMGGVGNLPDMQSSMTFLAIRGREYRIALDGVDAAAGPYVLNWTQSLPVSGGRLAGDFDLDGCTDLNDFLFLLDNWMLDFMGTPVGLTEFLGLLDNWNMGTTCGIN